MERIKEEETLYEEALESIRQLNEEVFLKDLREMMRKEVGYITGEIEHTSNDSKEMLSRLASELYETREKIDASKDATKGMIEELGLRVNATFSKGDQNLLKGLQKMEKMVERTTESYKSHTANQLSHHLWLSEQWRRQGLRWAEEQDVRLTMMDAIQKDIRTTREEWEESARMFLQSTNGHMESLFSLEVSFKAGLQDINKATEGILSTTGEVIPELKSHRDALMKTLQADWANQLQAQRIQLDYWKEGFDKQIVQIEGMINELTRSQAERVREQEEILISRNETILDKQSQVQDAVMEYVSMENERIRMEQVGMRKQNRWWFGGGVLLISTIQIVLHFI